jgi:hypothetical protein
MWEDCKLQEFEKKEVLGSICVSERDEVDSSECYLTWDFVIQTGEGGYCVVDIHLELGDKCIHRSLLEGDHSLEREEDGRITLRRC